MDMDSGFTELLLNAKNKILESKDSKINLFSY